MLFWTQTSIIRARDNDTEKKKKYLLVIFVGKIDVERAGEALARDFQTLGVDAFDLQWTIGHVLKELQDGKHKLLVPFTTHPFTFLLSFRWMFVWFR